jgi:hypothetical protein
MEQKKIDEEVVPGKRLGRNISHDPRSRNFSYKVPAKFVFNDLRTVVHRRYGEVFDQGDLGSCTGNAIAGAINSKPIYQRGDKTLHEADAVELYSLATDLDRYLGVYPPDDTGSSGLAVCKAAKTKGFITSYYHTFSVQQAVTALQDNCLITGIYWYEGFDNPDETGLVKIEGEPRGGHEIEVVGFHRVAKKLAGCIVEFENSWGAGWGMNGRFYMTVKDWDTLLDEQGDVTVPLKEFLTV